MEQVKSGVVAAGDNSQGQLWNSKLKVSPQFVLCNEFPYTPSQITAISAWGQSFAVAVNAIKVGFKKEDSEMQLYTIGMVKSLLCLENTVIAHLTDGSIVDVLANEFYPENGYISVSASAAFVCAVNSSGQAYLWKGLNKSNPEILIENASVIGCTNTTIYVATTDGKLFRFEDGDQSEMNCFEPLIDIKCSDTESLFLSNTGNVYKCEFGALSQVYGIPPVVSIAVGPQHFACISPDGKLFTWGFNPSGQLGFGNDKPATDPVKVLDDCIFAACGSHHTIVVKSATLTPHIPAGFERSLVRSTGSSIASKGITRAEMLF